MKRRKVGLFGWYMHGNFGDDVMAVMFARTIQAAGFQPVVYKKPHYLAELHGVESADSMSALVEDAVACVLGGGGLLVSADHAPSPKILQFDDEFRELSEICKARSVPVWAASIGGTGAGRAARLYPGLAILLASGVVRGATLRLNSDKALLDVFRIPSQHFPDVVFAAPDFWSPRVEGGPRTLLLTNNLTGLPFGNALLRLLRMCGPTILGLRTTDVMTRHASLARAEPAEPGGQRRFPYKDVQSLVDLLSSASVIVSSKLHPGIFAMAYGAVFFSYRGKAKTLAQLAELGLQSHVLTGRSTSDCLRLIRGQPLVEDAAADRARDLRTAARGHLGAVTDFLRSIPASPASE